MRRLAWFMQDYNLTTGNKHTYVNSISIRAKIKAEEISTIKSKSNSFISCQFYVRFDDNLKTSLTDEKIQVGFL